MRLSKPLLLIVLIFTIGCGGYAQKPAAEKFQHAVERSQDAALILSLLAQSNSGFPSELIAKAQVVAVFPHLVRQDALVRRFLQGYGVLSARTENGWSLPGFYQFESAPRKFSGGSQENLALVLLFMDKDSLSWLAKDKSEFKHERAAVIGPLAGEAQSQSGKPVLAYTYYNGKLNKIDPDFFNDFTLDQDNNINTPLYTMKGRDVLSGKKLDATALPTGVTAYADELNKHWPSQN